MSDYGGSKTPDEIKDLWQTPPEIYEALNAEFNFVADIAASELNHLHCDFLTVEDDALSGDWIEATQKGYVWCNPPYSNIRPWVGLAAQAMLYGVGVVMLVPADTSVGWFSAAKSLCSELRFIENGRISFVRADTKKPVNGNNKGSVIFVFNPYRQSAALTSFIDRDQLMKMGRLIIEGADDEKQ